jgi:FtsZ-binding cell division protein ZapB
MLNLEQVKLLETKVAKAVEYVERLTGENAVLRLKETELQAKMESYQKRIDELEIVMLQFKEDQGHIEDGILSALDKLNRFEEAMEKSLKGKSSAGKGAVKDTVKTRAAVTAAPAPAAAKPAAEPTAAASDGGEVCFEIPDGMAANAAGDIDDPLMGEADDELRDDPAEDGELDIF